MRTVLRIRRSWLLLIGPLLLGMWLVLSPAGAATPTVAHPAVPNLTSADAQELLGVLNDPKKRAAFITTLSNLSKAMKPATPAAKAVAAAGLAPNSLGADVLIGAGSLGSTLADQAGDFERAMHDFRGLGPWFRSIVGDPYRRAEVLRSLGRLAVVLAASLLAVVGINRLLKRPIGVIARWSSGMAPGGATLPDAEGDPAGLPVDEEVALRRHNVSFRKLLYALTRLPFALVHLLLELLPVLGFATVAFALQVAGFLGSYESRLVVSTTLRCFIVAGVAIAVVNTLFSPGSPSLRLLMVSDRVARLVTFWLRAMLLVGAWGFSSILVMQTLGLSDYASVALEKALMLLEHTLLACLIVRSRSDVANRLQPPRRIGGVPRRILATFANRWWIYALVLNYAFWLIWALQIKNGFARLWSISIETALVVVAARLVAIALLGGLARGMRFDDQRTGRYPWMRPRAERYYPILRRLVTMAVSVAAAIVLLQVWGVDAVSWFNRGALGNRLFSALTSVLAALLVGVVIWEAANIAMDRHVDRLEHDPLGGMAKVARVRTLLPILRIMLSIALVAIIALTVLSEIGVNIAPLLGGAGIVGVAIGFGSQKLVQDFITGIFLLLENAMQVGDWVTAGGLSGSVEHLSIRTIRLRAGDGSVHIIPFSSVTTVTNTNRGLGNAPVSVDVDPQEDADRAGDVLKEVVLTLRADPDYKDGMLSDLQYWGVDKVTSQAMTLVGQIACTDRTRYGVQREFNRRMKLAFAEHGIRLAMPAQAVMVVRDAPETQVRDAPETQVRDAPETQVRDAPEMRVRDAPGTQAGQSPAISHGEDGPTNVTDSPPTAALGHSQ